MPFAFSSGNSQANLPWSRYTWLGNGHTVPCDALPANRQGPPFTAVMLLTHPVGAPEVELPSYRGDRVNLLWMVPITERELSFAIEHGSPALVSKLVDAGAGWCSRSRSEISV